MRRDPNVQAIAAASAERRGKTLGIGGHRWVLRRSERRSGLHRGTSGGWTPRRRLTPHGRSGQQRQQQSRQRSRLQRWGCAARQWLATARRTYCYEGTPGGPASSAGEKADVGGAAAMPQQPPKTLREDRAAAASRTLTIFITSLMSLSLPDLSLDTTRFRPGINRGDSSLSTRVLNQRHLSPLRPLGDPPPKGHRQHRQLLAARTAGLLWVHTMEHLRTGGRRRKGRYGGRWWTRSGRCARVLAEVGGVIRGTIPGAVPMMPDVFASLEALGPVIDGTPSLDCQVEGLGVTRKWLLPGTMCACPAFFSF